MNKWEQICFSITHEHLFLSLSVFLSIDNDDSNHRSPRKRTIYKSESKLFDGPLIFTATSIEALFEMILIRLRYQKIDTGLVMCVRFEPIRVQQLIVSVKLMSVTDVGDEKFW